MRKFLMAAALVAAQVFVASCASVDSGEYIQPHGQYGRSDGMFQRTDTNHFDMHVNGYRLQSLDSHAFYEDFTEYGDGDDGCIQNDWTVCSGTANEINFFNMPSGNRFVEIILGGNNTGADMDAGSLDLTGDAANGEGLELLWGGIYDADGAPFIIGESPAFYTCATITAADWSGIGELHVGFRRFEDTAAFDDFLDAAGIGVFGGASTYGDIKIETIDDNGATTTTDTGDNITDAVAGRYCTYVSAAGVVTYTVKIGSQAARAPTTTAAFTFDDGDPVIPHIYYLQSADLAGEIDLTEWEAGYQ